MVSADTSRDSGTAEVLIEQLHDQSWLRRRPVEEADMDITPMIDVTFLLLIFFLLAGRIDQDTPVELPPARHGTAVAMKSSAIITLAVGEGDAAAIYLGDGKGPDRRIEADDPTSQETAVVAYIEEQLASGKTSVLVKAEKQVKHRDVARVAAAAGKAGSGEMYVGVLEVP